ncbi:putative gluconeogenesis factor [Trichinella spiralis]|uniref:Gluconeogenesis factor n=1 Tax=Trichinella spiralis TaxID=6334 RepID=A0ABR3KVW5_TRISP
MLISLKTKLTFAINADASLCFLISEQLSSVENRTYMLSVYQMITVRGDKVSISGALLRRWHGGPRRYCTPSVTKSPPCKQLTSKDTAAISGSEAQTCGTGQACFIEQSTLHQ